MILQQIILNNIVEHTLTTRRFYALTRPLRDSGTGPTSRVIISGGTHIMRPLINRYTFTYEKFHC